MQQGRKITAAVLVAAGLLAGCAGRPGAVATYEGHSITQQEVQSVEQDMQLFLGPRFDEKQAIASVILGKKADELLAKYQLELKDKDVIELVRKTVTQIQQNLQETAKTNPEVLENYPIARLDVKSYTPSPATLSVFRLLLMDDQFRRDPQKAEKYQAFQAAFHDYRADLHRVKINPRYGTWSERAEVVPAFFNWLLDDPRKALAQLQSGY